jgi:Tfp pilus tip-associated adhesin PilY1
MFQQLNGIANHNGLNAAVCLVRILFQWKQLHAQQPTFVAVVRQPNPYPFVVLVQHQTSLSKEHLVHHFGTVTRFAPHGNGAQRTQAKLHAVDWFSRR